MTDRAEEAVSRFYNTVGWTAKDGITDDARRFEDLRPHAREYVSKCRLRVLWYIPEKGAKILDMASGPIQYKEYLDYSKNFEKRYCVDLSSQALEDARMKIGDHGVFLHGSFLDIPLSEGSFDCVISLHTIYHIDKDKQEEAVRKLIYVTKPEHPVIIVYSNPNTFCSHLKPLFRFAKRAKSLLNPPRESKKLEEALFYFHAYPLEWWRRFADTCEIRIWPWRSFESSIQKRLIPDNKIGRKLLAMLFDLEDRFPDFFVKHFQYPMIVMIKRAKA